MATPEKAARIMCAAAGALEPLTLALGPDRRAWAATVADVAGLWAARLLGAAEPPPRGLVDPRDPVVRAAALATGVHALATAVTNGREPDAAGYSAGILTLAGMLVALAPTEPPDVLTCHDIPLGDGRSLRVGMEPDGSLILAVGDGEGGAWRERRGEGVSLPPGTFPALLDALRGVTQDA